MHGWRRDQMPTVPACETCNQKKAACTFDEHRLWLMSDSGYEWLKRVWTMTSRMKPIDQCNPIAGYHRCAAYRPCNVLRSAILCLGDGTDVLDYAIGGKMLRDAA